jgi:ApbE superfamily uncharacterized protein (UPF0280 family)
MKAHCAALDGGRWHFQHGPIDAVIGADGGTLAVARAHAAARDRFQTVLQELSAELPLLRQPVAAHAPPEDCPLRGVVARRMWLACLPHAGVFITPMAAVAGAVAQELIGCYTRPGVHRAWVNNGGDIALHLAPGASLRVGLFADLKQLDARQLLQGLHLDGRFTLRAADGVRGIATSGWRGRSFSLGIADSVTVLADSAAAADAAATVIANAVNIEHAGIVRRPAETLKDDSDLGALRVTVAVPTLPPALVKQALSAGAERARDLQSQGLIRAALLCCQGQSAKVTALAQTGQLAQGEPAWLPKEGIAA